MSLGISANDFSAILADLGTALTYRAYAGSLDEFGGTSYSFAADTTKTWIFFKHGSKTFLSKFGIVEEGDAYVIVPATVTISYRDRIVYNSETFEYTPDCVWAERKAGGTSCYKYYTLKKVG